MPRDEAGQKTSLPRSWSRQQLSAATSVTPLRLAGLTKLDLVGSAGAQGKPVTWAGRDTAGSAVLGPCVQELGGTKGF